NGTITWRTRTTLWGTTTWPRNATAHTPLRFPGQYHDPETGLHYNHHRYYNPTTAHYLTPDPLGLTPAPNPTTYPHNPHTRTDHLGLAPDCGDDLYRSDTREPSEIFEVGFEPRGANMDLWEHVSGWSKDSGFISTTTSQVYATSRSGNTYIIRGVEGIDVNREFPGNPFSHEREVAIPGRVDAKKIVGCWLPDGTWVPNPNYKEG
ncbi:RHS repeat-associated core domain-containing protein, partial [Wenjunlia vitaminophila]|uniref:RHS repeat-associated core domain-containing protein n=1 Tax=Wenjunlia vitaminophila TaxID=76728 RepID=UPI002AFE57E0